MRLSELLGAPVHDNTGREVGGVGDVVLVQDGPLVSPHSASYRVAGLIVVQRRHSRLLGYERDDVRPVLFRYAVRKFAGQVFNIPWEHVAEVRDGVVTLRVGHADLDDHDRAMRT